MIDEPTEEEMRVTTTVTDTHIASTWTDHHGLTHTITSDLEIGLPNHFVTVAATIKDFGYEPNNARQL